MKALLTGLSLFLGVFVIGQGNNDSLLNIWNSPSHHDTVRLNALHDFVQKNILYQYPDSAQNYTDQALKLAEGLKDNYMKLDFQAAAFMQKASSYYVRAKYTEAIQFYNAALNNYMKMSPEKNRKNIASCITNIGNIYYTQANFKQAKSYYQDALDHHKTIDAPYARSIIHHNLGSVLIQLEEFEEAQDNLKKALVIRKRLNKLDKVISTLNSLAVSYYDQGKFQKSLDQHLNSLQYYDSIEDKKPFIHPNDNAARCYLDLGNYSQAEFHAKQGLDLVEKTGDINDKRNITKTLYKVYSASGKYKKGPFPL
jgi:tetratricopeptide (TPR) repeat protein